jgi:hypothetical protein
MDKSKAIKALSDTYISFLDMINRGELVAAPGFNTKLLFTRAKAIRTLEKVLEQEIR